MSQDNGNENAVAARVKEEAKGRQARVADRPAEEGRVTTPVAANEQHIAGGDSKDATNTFRAAELDRNRGDDSDGIKKAEEDMRQKAHVDKRFLNPTMSGDALAKIPDLRDALGGLSGLSGGEAAKGASAPHPSLSNPDHMQALRAERTGPPQGWDPAKKSDKGQEGS